MTFTRKLLRLDETLVNSALAQFSGADGTAAFLTAGAGDYHTKRPDTHFVCQAFFCNYLVQRDHRFRIHAV